MKPRTAKQILEAGYQNLLDSEWAQGCRVFNDGCHCMITAIKNVGPIGPRTKAVVLLAKACVGEDKVKNTCSYTAAASPIVETNDHPDFTRAKALARYRKAIALAGKK